MVDRVGILLAGKSAAGRIVRLGTLVLLMVIVSALLWPEWRNKLYARLCAMDKDDWAATGIAITLATFVAAQFWQILIMRRNSLQILLQNRIEYQKLLFEVDKLEMQNPVLRAMHNGNEDLLSLDPAERKRQRVQVEAYASYHVNLIEVVYVFFQSNQELLTDEELKVYEAWKNWIDYLLETSLVFSRVLKQGIAEKSYNQLFVDYVTDKRQFKDLLARALFPQLSGKRWAIVDLNARAKRDCPGRSRRFNDNPLNDPKKCSDWLDQVHEYLGVDFSYGGYLEDRSHLWRGHYQDQEKSGKFIHLGIDYNVPKNTDVYAPIPLTVHEIWADPCSQGGWGGRVILNIPGTKIFVLYGHLDPTSLPAVGTALQSGDRVGIIGGADVNGGWFPHLHIQCNAGELPADLHELDGYETKRCADTCRYPNPMIVL